MTDLKTILLAEDKAKDVELIMEALAEHNLADEVVVVNDGADALDYLHCRGKFGGRAQTNPAVVLLDIKMPKVDGLQVLAQIKTDTRLKNIPVVILTSSREEQDLVKSYQLGVNSYVVKPIDFSDFITAVKQLGIFWALINEPPPGTVKPHLDN